MVDAKQIVFRVDGSIKIGVGHIMRCFNLASVLREKGYSILFICRYDPALLSLFERTVWTYEWLPARSSMEISEDAADTWECLKKYEQRCEWIIVDHYALDQQWECDMRAYCDHLLVIDDLANRAHNCDLLVDQNYYKNMDTRYTPWVNSACQLLLGPRYVLFRQDWADVKSHCRLRASLATIVINFGGSDPSNETRKALLGALRVTKNINIIVVVGIACPHQAEIKALVKQHARCEYYCQPDNFLELLIKADLAIGAGGTALWERLALGLPAIVTSVAQNQQQIIEDVSETGCIDYLGEHTVTIENDYAEAIEHYYRDPTKLSVMSGRCRDWVDGRGALRVAEAMASIESVLSIVPVERSDMRAVYDWRNSVEVSRWSGSQEPITWEAHTAWFERVMSDPDRRLLLVKSLGEPIGVIRLDRIREGVKEHVELSVYLVPSHMGKGWGAKVIRAGRRVVKAYFPEAREIIAKVLMDNVASHTVFQRAGFQERAPWYDNGQQRGVWYACEL